MANFPDPIRFPGQSNPSVPLQSKSDAIIVYDNPKARGESFIRRIFDLFMARAFKLQFSEASLPGPFTGSCNEFVKRMGSAIHQTIDKMDYDGLRPYIKILDQLDKKRTLENIKIDSREEEQGSTCVGMSHAILKVLRQNGVEGALAAQRRGSSEPLEHGAVIVECADGYVLIDSRSNPNYRIFQVPFNRTELFDGFTLTASHRGSTTPLTLVTGDKQEFEFCTNITNADDLIMKLYVLHSGMSFTPISCYFEDGSPKKYIMVLPSEGKIVLKDKTVKEGRTQEISFKAILEEGFLLPTLEAFMGKDFQVSAETAYREIVRLVTQEARIKQLYEQIIL